MQLVVGRIARPHGVRGEVAVEVRTDDPELRLGQGRRAGDRARDGRPADRAAHPLALWSAAGHIRRHSRTGTGPTTCAASCSWSMPSDLEDIADPDEFRDHQLIGLAVVTTDGEQVGDVTDVLHHGQDLLVVAGSGQRAGTEIMIPFVAAHRARGRPGRRRLFGSIRRLACSTRRRLL